MLSPSGISAQETPSNVRDSGNATICDSGNASVAQHFHFRENATAAQPKAAPERSKRRPNVQFVRTSSITISHDDKRDIFYEGGKDAWNGTVALFRNASLADAEVDDAEYVRAQII